MSKKMWKKLSTLLLMVVMVLTCLLYTSPSPRDTR